MSQYDEGEVTIQAYSGNRKMTLDPIREIMQQTPWREVENTIPCGLRSPWVSGELEGADFMLATGSGTGSPWMTFNYRGRSFCIDVRDIIMELCARVDSGVDLEN